MVKRTMVIFCNKNALKQIQDSCFFATWFHMGTRNGKSLVNLAFFSGLIQWGCWRSGSKVERKKVTPRNSSLAPPLFLRRGKLAQSSPTNLRKKPPIWKKYVQVELDHETPCSSKNAKISETTKKETNHANHGSPWFDVNLRGDFHPPNATPFPQRFISQHDHLTITV